LPKSVGRPVTKSGSAAAKKRAQSRKEYQSLTVAERKARVQNRDKEAQRRADAKRYAKSKGDRDAYHRDQAKAKTKAPPKPKACQWPGCKRTDIEFHHQGGDRWLCPTHHAAARRKS
jgi:Asp-tRNA(Asn)/Glu-tRNA(Gln) amidotransferase A subunit family amidase